MHDTINVLVAEDPETQAARLLARIVAHAQATGGAVLAFAGSDLAVFASRCITVAGLERTRSLWIERREEIIDRRGIQVGVDALYHLGRGTEPVGLLFLEGGALARAAVEPYLMALGAAVAAGARRELAPTTVPSRELVNASVGENRKERLLRVLNDVEWNLAFTARRFGVSRRTIYLWMERYAIQRPERSTKSRRGASLERAAADA